MTTRLLSLMIVLLSAVLPVSADKKPVTDDHIYDQVLLKLAGDREVGGAGITVDPALCLRTDYRGDGAHEWGIHARRGTEVDRQPIAAVEARRAPYEHDSDPSDGKHHLLAAGPTCPCGGPQRQRPEDVEVDLYRERPGLDEFRRDVKVWAQQTTDGIVATFHDPVRRERERREPGVVDRGVPGNERVSRGGQVRTRP